MNSTAWKSDNYKFVGKAFDFTYANYLNKLTGSILGVVHTRSIDYELRGAGGYGEMQPYDGNNLNFVDQKRGFATVITPGEFNMADVVGRKQARIDKSGECAKVGQRLATSAAMTVYAHALRMLSGAFNPDQTGGDGKPWAAKDHPVASKGSVGRRYLPDPDAGTFSNLIASTLTVDHITEAQSMANRFITPDGLPYLCEMDLLLVSPELEATAKKICGDNGKYRPTRNPDDNSNAANPVADLQYMVIGGGNNGFSAKQWAICDKTRMKEIFKLVYEQEPMVVQQELDNPLKDVYVAYADYGLGWGDARPIIFSNP